MSISMQALAELKSIDDIDFNEIELSSGQTPDDINAQCLRLCVDYLGGVWTQRTPDSIAVKRVMGGVTNQLYYCAIGSHSDETEGSGVPQEVAIRLYGRKYFTRDDSQEREDRLNDVITALLASQSQLGPQVYGIFDGGEILKYYKHRAFGVEEQKDAAIGAKVFEKLAKWHSLETPMKKSQWIGPMFEGMFESARQYPGLRELIAECNLHTLKRHDIQAERQWLMDLIRECDSPVVFAHNDFRSANIMVLEDNNNNDKTTADGGGDEGIVFCDFDASRYGHRGLDFGTIWWEWGRTFNDYKREHVFPDDRQIVPLIEAYIRESTRIYGPKYGENARNSVRQILKEVKVFSLVYAMFRVLVDLRCDDKTQETFCIPQRVVLSFTEIQYKNYWHLKNLFMKQQYI
ncbi:unnamed protein product [Medioppia subpectinata]|uniref:Choline/ethanolamine kinase n=1 Tax=Medioppia subpectinata TaxID=1979941 RepID=A0A7R9KTU2_9ACAR|nr:unnamed protein product [Medioppia subpectinata]CAG2109384.1 unnamed protein product [Medioppia subpectinata]